MNTTIIGKFCFSAFDYIHLTSTKTLKYWLCVFEYSVFFTSMEMFLHLCFLKCFFFFISDQLSNRTFTTLFVLILSQLKVKESCFYIFYSSQEEYVLLQELFGFRKCDEDRNEVKWVQVLLVKKMSKDFVRYLLNSRPMIYTSSCKRTGSGRRFLLVRLSALTVRLPLLYFPT